MTIHQEPEQVHGPASQEQGKPCRTCGAPLADDQRYCLNCGQRRAEARLPFLEVLEQRYRREPPAVSPVASAAPWRPTPAMAGGAVAALFLALGLGLLIGSSGDDPAPKVVAAPPQVITVAGAGAAAPVEQFKGDWPDGKEGYTIQLQTLPKDGTQVSAVTCRQERRAVEGRG